MSKRPCGNRFSCKQCCFSLPIRDSEKGPLTAEEIDIMINSNAIGLDSMNFIEMIIFSVWQFFGMVAGFAIYNGTGSANPVTHFAWWSFIELVVIYTGKGLGKFSLAVPPKNPNKLEMSVYDAIKSLNYYTFVLIIGIVSNAVHAALTFCELSSGTSTFATASKGFCITFAIMLLVTLVFVQGFLLYRTFAYVASLEYALKNATPLFDATPSAASSSSSSGSTPTAAGAELESAYTHARRVTAALKKTKPT